MPPVWAQTLSQFRIADFNLADLTVDSGNALSDDGNLSGRNSFGTSYAMRAYLRMYRTTDDTFYLDKLVGAADNVLANRDDVVPGGPAEAAWDQSAPSNGYLEAPGTAGLIIGPMVAFARLVNETPALAANPLYSARATEYIDRSRETITFINDNFLVNFSPGQSSYDRFLGGSARGHAHSDMQMAVTMRDFAQVVGVGTTEGIAMLTLVDEIQSEIVDSAFYNTPSGNLAWQNSSLVPTAPGSIPDPDDFSHAAIIAPHLASFARQDGSIITPAHGAAFAKTIIEEAYQGGGIIAPGFVGADGTTALVEARVGTDPFTTAWGIAGGFIEFAQFDLRILPIAEAVQLANYGTGTDGVLWPTLGLANIVRYNEVPQNLLLDVTVGAYSTDGPVAINLTGPTQIQLSDGSNIEEFTIELGGSGDELLRQWDLSVEVDASGTALVGQSADLTFLFVDGTGETKEITGSVDPAGFASTLDPLGEDALLQGLLQSTQQFEFSLTENMAPTSPLSGVAVVPEPTSFALLAMPALFLCMLYYRQRSDDPASIG